jgi:undecaprenyl-diphosphatase
VCFPLSCSAIMVAGDCEPPERAARPVVALGYGRGEMMPVPINHPPAPEPPTPSPKRPEARAPANGAGAIALLAAAMVGAISAFVTLLLTADVRRDTGFTRADWRVLSDVRSHSSSLLVDGAQALARLGNIETLILVAVVVGLLLRRRGLHPILCAAPLASLLVAGGFVQIMKVSIARPGPRAQLHLGAVAGGSFPSGHSADTMALSVALAIVLVAVLVRRPAERVAVFGSALALSVAVGVSRLVLGVHWPTDVVAGWAVGLGAAVSVGTLAVLATRNRALATASAHTRTS